jgi:cell division septum initiation protein DivIVA
MVQAAVQKVRTEEKEKLYPEISRLTEQVSSLTEAEKQRQAEAQAAEEEAKKKAEEARLAEMTALERTAELEARLEQQALTMQEELAQRDAMLQKEREHAELVVYTNHAVAANQDNILPELRDLVTGNTREEVDASISALVTRTNAILGSVAGVADGTPAPPPSGASVTGAPPVGPMETQDATRQYTPEEIAKMSMGEWSKVREQMLSQQGQRVREQGLYG